MEAIRKDLEVIEERDNDLIVDKRRDSSALCGRARCLTERMTAPKFFEAGWGQRRSMEKMTAPLPVGAACSRPHTVNASVVRLLARDAPKNLAPAVSIFGAGVLGYASGPVLYHQSLAGHAGWRRQHGSFLRRGREKLPLDKLLSIVSSDSTRRSRIERVLLVAL